MHKILAVSLRERFIYVWTKCYVLHTEFGMQVQNDAFCQSCENATQKDFL